MKLSEIRAETRTIVVSFEAGDLKVVYRPNVFTADVADKAAQQANDNPAEATDHFLDTVTSVMVSWDLEGDDGEIIPIEKARIRSEVPVPVFARIFRAITEDQTAGAEGKA